MNNFVEIARVWSRLCCYCKFKQVHQLVPAGRREIFMYYSVLTDFGAFDQKHRHKMVVCVAQGLCYSLKTTR